MGADVEHHGCLAARGQGPLGPGTATVSPVLVTVVLVTPVVVTPVVVTPVVVTVAGAHRQLAGTKKPLWGTPR